jgi:hypothetical protein
MELTLTPELETLIVKKLATGRYANAEQILVEALKSSVVLDEQRDATLNALRHMFDDGSEESASARTLLRQHQDDWHKAQS